MWIYQLLFAKITFFIAYILNKFNFIQLTHKLHILYKNIKFSRMFYANIDRLTSVDLLSVFYIFIHSVYFLISMVQICFLFISN
jgi:hypothetical protein